MIIKHSSSLHIESSKSATDCDGSPSHSPTSSWKLQVDENPDICLIDNTVREDYADWWDCIFDLTVKAAEDLNLDDNTPLYSYEKFYSGLEITYPPVMDEIQKPSTSPKRYNPNAKTVNPATVTQLFSLSNVEKEPPSAPRKCESKRGLSMNTPVQQLSRVSQNGLRSPKGVVRGDEKPIGITKANRCQICGFRYQGVQRHSGTDITFPHGSDLLYPSHDHHYKSHEHNPHINTADHSANMNNPCRTSHNIHNDPRGTLDQRNNPHLKQHIESHIRPYFGSDIQDCISALCGHKNGLHVAARNGDIASCRRWVEKGLDLDSPDNDGNTALCLAVHRGHRPIAEYLLAAGANVNAPMRGVSTPLQLAIEAGEFEIARLLLSHKDIRIDQPTPDPNGKPTLPVDFARSSGNTELLQLLQSKHKRLKSAYDAAAHVEPAPFYIKR